VTKGAYWQGTGERPQTMPQSMRDHHLEERPMDIGTTLMLSILFGSIGAGYFIYGKKQQQCVPLLTGITTGHKMHQNQRFENVPGSVLGELQTGRC